MVFLYLIAIFVIGLSTYAVYYARTNHNNINKNLIPDTADNFIKFQDYMETPIGNINKTLTLLESISQLCKNIQTDDLSMLKSHLNTIKESIKQLDNKELSDALIKIQQNLQTINFGDKLSVLENKLDSLRSLTCNIKIPNEFQSIIRVIETSIKKVQDDVKNFKKIEEKINQINIADDMVQIKTKLEGLLPMILNLGSETKQVVESLSPQISNDIKKILTESFAKHITELTKTLTNINSILVKLDEVKTSIRDTILGEFSQLNTEVNLIKTNVQNNQDSINNIIQPTLVGVKERIDQINLEPLQEIKTNTEKVSTMFRRVLDVLRPGARNLLLDANIIIKDDTNNEHTYQVKNGFYTERNLEEAIRKLLPSHADTFKISIKNGKVNIEYFFQFHMDNNIRDLLGFPKTDTHIFMKSYRAPNDPKFEHVILETITHKVSVDAIFKKIKGQLHNQIDIVNKLPDQVEKVSLDVNTLLRKLYHLPNYPELKMVTDKIAELGKNLDILNEIGMTMKERYVKEEFIKILDIFFRLPRYENEFKDYFKVNMTDSLTLKTILAVLETKFKTEFNNMSDKFVEKFKNEMLTKNEFITQNHNLSSAFTQTMENFEKRITKLIQEKKTN
jgi:phage shock protein A